jgi:hypothetical protein
MERYERALSKVKPPRELRTFHGEVERSVRAVVLGLGKARRGDFSGAEGWYVRAAAHYQTALLCLKAAIDGVPELKHAYFAAFTNGLDDIPLESWPPRLAA